MKYNRESQVAILGFFFIHKRHFLCTCKGLYTQNNNPDDYQPEDRRDFCLPSRRQVAVTDRHIIYTADL